MPSNLPVLLSSGEPNYVPSTYMPNVSVEIAFNAGYTTPDADRMWTDVSEYVELADRIGIGVGRQDERSTADANSLTLTLDNTDGRFTAKRAASPYYPNVKVGRPIRVSAMVDGFTTIRFVGFIDQWPVEWDGTDAYAKATIRAASRLSRLGLGAKLRSVIEQEIQADSPDAYWTLGDPSGSTSAVEASGNGGTPLSPGGGGTSTIAFGNATGPGTDGLTACTFTLVSGERYLIAPLPSGTSSSSFGVGCFFSTSTAGASQGIIGHPSGDFGSEVVLVGTDATGRVVAGITVAGVTTTVTSANSYNDGSTHHTFITISAGTLTLYVDGVSVGSAGGVGVRTIPELRVGQIYTGVVAHVEVYAGASPTLPSAARIAAHADAGLDGFSGDTTDERLLRILSWAGVASTEVDAEAGSETMTYQQTSGMSVVDALRDVESTEGGVLFDGPDGKVVFHNRARRYLATPAATLDMESQHVGADYAPRLDRSALANDVTVENPTTGETARAVDTTSSDEYGIATSSATSVADSYDPLQQKASWLVASYAEPSTRVPSLTVDVLAHRGLTPSAQDLLAVGVGDLIAVVNAPTQADTTDTSYFVEGYTETVGPESWFITFNLSPTHPSLSAFVLDDADRGVLDTSILGY